MVMTEDRHYEEGPLEERTLAQGPHAGRSFRLALAACPNPLCACMAGFVKANEAQGATSSSFEFALDLEGQCLHETFPCEEATKALAEGIASELGPDEWARLAAWWYAAKDAQMRRADLADLEPEFPECVFEDSKNLVCYGEIVKHAKGYVFDHLGSPWLAEDNYCINPGCPCQDARLFFIPLSLPSEPEVTPELFAGDLPQAIYDYRSGKIQAFEAKDAALPRAQALVQSLRASQPGLEAELNERHDRLRSLFQITLVRQGRRHGPYRNSNKVGRNEPCPCGSGRKYKRCCGMRD